MAGENVLILDPSLVSDEDALGEARVAVDALGLTPAFDAETETCEIIAEDATTGVEAEADDVVGSFVTKEEVGTEVNTVVSVADADPEAEEGELGKTPEVETGTTNGENGNVVKGGVLVTPALITTFWNIADPALTTHPTLRS
ncbi:hypothetical protein ACEPAG_7405 [Sanghuangporus baumii]